MCNKNTGSEIQTNSIMKRTKKQIKNPSTSSSSSSSSSSLKRRNRSKTRRPKFVSLRLKLSQPKRMAQAQARAQPKVQEQPQLNLFPLHPENLVDMHEENENNVALLFSSDGGATLNGLLEDESTTTATATTTTTTSASEEGSLSAMTCPAMELVRKAMRKRGMESEERWVSYSEVVEEKKETTEEVNSRCGGANTTTSFGLLSLKLDHEGILNAWSDKGSLYVAGDEAPQSVPDVLNGLPFHNSLVPNVPWDGWGSSDVGNTWKVPEDCEANKMKMKEETGWNLGQREASVQRYKEKRQSRLFSKRIRYEVRKLNAEKRPRMKGRFVKRE